MTEVTDADRKRAFRALGWHESWGLGDLNDSDRNEVEAIAAALAEEREKALASVGDVGRCGVESPGMGPLRTNICALPAGHPGWHREGTTEWGIRRAAEETE